MVLAIAELGPSGLAPASLEAVVAARQMRQPVTVVLPGADVVGALEPLANADVAELVALEHDALVSYTPDAHVAALAAFVATQRPVWVVAAHTYQARDYVPALAARLRRGLATGCTAIGREGDRVVLSRPVFGGKLAAEIVIAGDPPYFATVQLGAFSRDDVGRALHPVPVRREMAAVDVQQVRQRPEPRFREATSAVDLSRADRIVAVGRGIKAREQLEVVEKLAAALGAEMAASRPICDAGWLPMDRQVGSSGQTVAPRLYVAVGISGAIQHIVGMRGARTVVAINKDPQAPIFEVADYGIVGDLFEVVPAIVRALTPA
ncbi:MAG: electron transfer flavoprotein subunit alpha/FixB family protein [Acidobacteria bacterium]|nr:electron transfer flavoprotein subunit alpha/FixB family protein [Acidobacteriota bacterium]